MTKRSSGKASKKTGRTAVTGRWVAPRSRGKASKKTGRTAVTGRWVAPRNGGYSAKSHSGRFVTESSSKAVKPPSGRAGVSRSTGAKK